MKKVIKHKRKHGYGWPKQVELEYELRLREIYNKIAGPPDRWLPVWHDYPLHERATKTCQKILEHWTEV